MQVSLGIWCHLYHTLALGNDEVMTPLWLKSSSMFSIRDNCSSFVSLKADFEVNHLPYVHNEVVAMSCLGYAMRLSMFGCFDCWNFMYGDWNDCSKQFDAVWCKEENAEVDRFSSNSNSRFSCSKFNILQFVSFSHHLFFVSTFLLPHLPLSLSLCLCVWPTWQSPDRALIAMIKPALGDTEWRLDKCDHPDGRGWSGAGWQLPMFLSWDSLLPRRSGHQSPWWVDRDGCQGGGSYQDGELSKRVLKSMIWSLSKWLVMHCVYSWRKPSS